MSHHSPITAARPTTTEVADRIVVNGLIVETFIGVHDFERDAPQRVRFDIEIETVADYADRVRTTGDYVSYADIVDHVRGRATAGDHVTLVETWADDVAEFALRNELAAVARVTVQKLDIFDNAQGVGVAIERRRADDNPDPA